MGDFRYDNNCLKTVMLRCQTKATKLLSFVGFMKLSETPSPNQRQGLFSSTVFSDFRVQCVCVRLARTIGYSAWSRWGLATPTPPKPSSGIEEPGSQLASDPASQPLTHPSKHPPACQPVVEQRVTQTAALPPGAERTSGPGKMRWSWEPTRGLQPTTKCLLLL